METFFLKALHSQQESTQDFLKEIYNIEKVSDLMELTKLSSLYVDISNVDISTPSKGVNKNVAEVNLKLLKNRLVLLRKFKVITLLKNRGKLEKIVKNITILENKSPASI